MLCQKNKLNIKNDCGNDVVPHPPRWQFQAFHGALSEPSTFLPGLASGLSGSAGSWDADSKFFHYQVNQIYSMWDCPNIKVLFDVIWTTMHTCWSYKYESSTIFWTVMTENLTRHSLWVFFDVRLLPNTAGDAGDCLNAGGCWKWTKLQKACTELFGLLGQAKHK